MPSWRVLRNTFQLQHCFSLRLPILQRLKLREVESQAPQRGLLARLRCQVLKLNRYRS